MPPPVTIGWRFPAGVPTFWAPPPVPTLPPPNEIGDSIWVIVYNVPRPPLQAVRSYYYNSQPTDVTGAPAKGGGTYALPYVSRRLRISRPRRVLGVFAAPLVIVEAQPHYLAKFSPAKLIVWPGLRQHADFRPPVAAPQAIGGGTYALPYVSHKLRIFGRPRHPFVKAPPVATTAVTGAGFYPLLYFPRKSWIVNVSRYAIVPLQPETNPSFLATFKPTKLTVWPFLNSQDQGGPSPPPPAKGAGTYALPFISRKSRIFGRARHVFVAPPVAPSFATNTHSIGRFTPTKLLVSPLLYRQQPALDLTIAAEAQPHFVATFKSPPAWRFNYNSWDQSQPAVAETQPHFLARFTPVKFVVWSGFRQHADFQPPVIETNVHTIGRFTAAKLFVSPFLWQNYPGDLNSVIIPVAETNVHFLATFKPAKLFVWPLLWQHTDTGVPQVETNVHFLAKFSPTKFTRFAYNSWDIEPPTPETNVHFIGAFRQVPTWRFNYNSTDTGVPQAETNPHFIGRFCQVSTWRFNYNSHDTSVAQVETNPHYVARFNPAQLSWFRYNSTDTGVPQVETNPHYIARYAPARLSWFAYNSTDTSVPQVETNPHHVGRFTSAKLIRFGYNTRADDPPVAEANPHFVATFRPTRVSQFGYNNRADDPPVVETNPHQIGSFRPTKITKLAALWNNPAADIFVQGPQGREAEPHFVGRFTPTKLISFRFNGVDTQVPPIPSIWMTAEARRLTATAQPRNQFATAEPRVRTSTWG